MSETNELSISYDICRVKYPNELCAVVSSAIPAIQGVSFRGAEWWKEKPKNSANNESGGAIGGRG